MGQRLEIAEELVEQSWQEVGRFGRAKATKEVQRVMGAQEALFLFILESTLELSQDAHELALYMALVIYRAYEKAHPEGLSKAKPKHVMAACRANEKWVEQTGRAHDRILEERILPNLSLSQPAVMRYVGDCLFEPDEELHLSEEDQGQLFLVMKTFVDVLDGCAAAKPGTAKGRSKARAGARPAVP